MTDETTSPERQLASTKAEAQRRCMTVIGVAEDLDVSASKTTPFERPKLGPWLNNRAHEFDVVIWWRQDRAVRSMTDMAILARWAKDNKKRLLFAEGPGGGPIEFDMSNSISELTMLIFAFAAQMESQSISDRTTGAKAFMRRVGRWDGGSVPLGYMPVKTNDGWRLVHDPVYGPIIQQVVDQVLAGYSIRALARDLTLRGIPTAKDLQRIRNGKWHPPMILRDWNPAGLTEILRSRNLLGQQTFKGGKGRGPEEIVRDESGLPVLKGEPLISRETWERLQETLSARTMKKSGSRSNGSLLLRVLFCGICGQPMYETNNGRGERYYKCASGRLFKCGNRAVQADAVEEGFVGALLALIGDIPRLIELRLPGEDHREELQELLSNYEAVSTQLVTARSSAGRGAAQRSLDALDARIAELETMPVLPPRSEWIPSGETWGKYWDELNTTERNGFLRASGVFANYVKVMPGGRAWVDASDPAAVPVVIYEPPAVDPPARSRQGESFFHFQFGILDELVAKAAGAPVEELRRVVDGTPDLPTKTGALAHEDLANQEINEEPAGVAKQVK